MTADALVRANRKEDAIKVLDRVYNQISAKSLPYIVSRDMENIGNIYMCMAYINAGEKEKSNKMMDQFIAQAESDIAYMNSLPDKAAGAEAAQFDVSILGNIANMARQVNRQDVFDKLMPVIQRLSAQVPR